MATYGQDDTNEGHVGEDEEDFYANNSANTSLVAAGDTLPGATNVNGQVNVRHIPSPLCLGESADPRCF